MGQCTSLGLNRGPFALGHVVSEEPVRKALRECGPLIAATVAVAEVIAAAGAVVGQKR